MINVSVNDVPSFNNPSAAFNGNPAKSKVTAPHIQTALAAIHGLNLKVEICGDWVWIFNANASHEISLRAANFKWSYKKGGWYLCPQNDKPRPRCQPWAMGKIREKYGSQIVNV